CVPASSPVSTLSNEVEARTTADLCCVRELDGLVLRTMLLESTSAPFTSEREGSASRGEPEFEALDLRSLCPRQLAPLPYSQCLQLFDRADHCAAEVIEGKTLPHLLRWTSQEFTLIVPA
ncbi:MAG: hypothetical protein ABSA96_19660, partial [Candidatus Acidiferrales bacterium]